jgi:hypothetical protein
VVSSCFNNFSNSVAEIRVRIFMIFIKKEKGTRSAETLGTGSTPTRISATASGASSTPTRISATASGASSTPTRISATASGASSTPTRISATAHAARAGPIYAIRLQARSGTDGIHALRAALKVLWRRYQLRCLEAREVKDGVDRVVGDAADAGTSRK